MTQIEISNAVYQSTSHVKITRKRLCLLAVLFAGRKGHKGEEQ